MTDIVLRSLKKSYGNVEVVRGIDLEIARNEFIVLVGPSGCGKTTTLRMIAGLETVSAGTISIGGCVVNDVPASQRNIAMVFQNYALFPHLTVRQNMAFGMWIRRTPRSEINRRIEETAEALGLYELLDRRPGQLSGGQRQRVAMGRAMVRDPKVFLFDEPLSNLDAKLRIQMRAEIRRVHERVRTTAVYVTHDQIEAMTLADRIVVMNCGHIEQVGTPNELYTRPKTAFVAGFIGSPSMSFVSCRLDHREEGLDIVFNNGQRLAVPVRRTDFYAPYTDRTMVFGIRPEHITERRAHTGKAQIDFEAIVEFIEPMGNDTMVTLRIGDTEVAARCSPEAALGRGASMAFSIDMDRMHLIDPNTRQVIQPEATNE